MSNKTEKNVELLKIVLYGTVKILSFRVDEGKVEEEWKILDVNTKFMFIAQAIQLIFEDKIHVDKKQIDSLGNLFDRFMKKSGSGPIGDESISLELEELKNFFNNIFSDCGGFNYLIKETDRIVSSEGVDNNINIKTLEQKLLPGNKKRPFYNFI